MKVANLATCVWQSCAKVLKFIYKLVLIKNLFMLSVRISSYGCTWEVGEHERCAREA